MGGFYSLLKRRHIFANRTVDHRAAFGVKNPTSCFLVPSGSASIKHVMGVYGRDTVPCFVLKGKDGLLMKSNNCHNTIVRVCGGVSTIAMRKARVAMRTNTLLSSITTTTGGTTLANFRFTNKVPKAVNNTIIVGTNTCNNRVGSILARMAIVSRRKRVIALPTSGLRLKCHADVVGATNCVILRTGLRLGRKGPRIVHRAVGSLAVHHAAGRPLRCPDTKDAFGEPRKCFTNGLVVSDNLTKCRMNNTRISRGRYNFIVGTNNTATESIHALVSGIESVICGGCKIALRPRIGFLNSFRT